MGAPAKLYRLQPKEPPVEGSSARLEPTQTGAEHALSVVLRASSTLASGWGQVLAFVVLIALRRETEPFLDHFVNEIEERR